eukprot:246122_1
MINSTTCSKFAVFFVVTLHVFMDFLKSMHAIDGLVNMFKPKPKHPNNSNLNTLSLPDLPKSSAPRSSSSSLLPSPKHTNNNVTPELQQKLDAQPNIVKNDKSAYKCGFKHKGSDIIHSSIAGEYCKYCICLISHIFDNISKKPPQTSNNTQLSSMLAACKRETILSNTSRNSNEYKINAETLSSNTSRNSNEYKINTETVTPAKELNHDVTKFNCASETATVVSTPTPQKHRDSYVQYSSNTKIDFTLLKSYLQNEVSLIQKYIVKTVSKTGSYGVELG